MSRFRRSCLALALALPGALFAAAPAQAQALPKYEPMCMPSEFPDQPTFHVATVGAATPRLYFFDDGDGCPERAASCQSKAYVVPGDTLLVGKSRGAWTCALYRGKTHDTGGWVDNAALTLQAGPPPDDWAGMWKTPGAFVAIARKNGVWRVHGKANWGSGSTMHFGDMAGVLNVEGTHAHLGGAPGPQVYDCIADLVRVGDYLIVHDNSQCGGMNVRFDGIYTRAR